MRHSSNNTAIPILPSPTRNPPLLITRCSLVAGLFRLAGHSKTYFSNRLGNLSSLLTALLQAISRRYSTLRRAFCLHLSKLLAPLTPPVDLMSQRSCSEDPAILCVSELLACSCDGLESLPRRVGAGGLCIVRTAPAAAQTPSTMTQNPRTNPRSDGMETPGVAGASRQLQTLSLKS
mmetsp:Transcript_31035/g.48631  ORF Transcript_31035/g.48631 Transcript_31035/m.48631 type:complete len:177 (-) Transcript_31035:335-865(-)